ncbi:MAG: hypothetical protein ACRDAP_11030, partial [Shewanella sp.]
MKSKLKGMTLLSLLSLGGCVNMEKPPQVPALTLADLRNELSQSEVRMQSTIALQQKQAEQQQKLLTKLNSDLMKMKESVKQVDHRVAKLPTSFPKPVILPAAKAPEPA